MLTTLSPASTPRIRPIQSGSDLSRVAALLGAVFGATLDHESRRALDKAIHTPGPILRMQTLGSRFVPGFVWEQDGRIAGNVSLIATRSPGRIIIANVAVASDCRRQGIARQLMETTLAYLHRNALHTAVLQVDNDNEGATRLYTDLGFESCGSTTWWSAPAGQWREIEGESADSDPLIRPLRSDEYRQAYALDSASFSPDLNWPDPILPTHYRRGWAAWFSDFFNGRQSERWVADREGAPVALGTIESEWGYAHRLALRVPAALRSRCNRPLLARLLHRLRWLPRRTLSIEHPQDDPVMDSLLIAANFTPRRHLCTMKLALAAKGNYP
jgi:GNAT superfamily N-acetyltransferase